MKSQPQRRPMRRLSTVLLLALGAPALTACASSQGRLELSPIPVAPANRAECSAPAQPADPVTPSAALQFSHAEAVYAACVKNQRDVFLGSIDAHNRAVSPRNR